MITISLCMIVKNEEAVLARCLESVGDAADEIIILDTGSTDATIEIAKQFTDKVYTFQWIDDFSAARNASFEKAACDYIMWLDADDMLLPEDREKLIELKHTLPAKTDLVMMKYHVAFDAAGKPTISNYRERLMRREKGYRWTGAVHEVIVPSGNIMHCDIAVTHRKQHRQDPDRNLRIFEALLARGQALSPREQFYYARELMYHGEYQAAADGFEAFLSGAEGWIEDRISACMDLASCRRRMGQNQKAFMALLASFRFDRPRAEICCQIGAELTAQGQYQTAIYWYEQACAAQLREGSAGFRQPDCYGFIPYMQLCLCYDRMGKLEEAYTYHRKAREIKPDDAAVAYNEAYFRENGFSD